MGKYAPLTEFLSAQKLERIRMTFDEIEQVIGTALPASKQYPAWWSNNPSNNVMTKAWLAAGYQTEQVDTVGGKLVFRRSNGGSAAASKSAGEAPSTARDSAGEYRAFYGFMKGKITLEPGYDPTQPAGEQWNAQDNEHPA